MNVRNVLLTLAAATLTACGGSSAPGSTQPVTPPAGQGVVVVTSPTSADVEPGKSVKFGASVTGSAETGVTWSVSEPDGGTIDASGLYTAPLTEGTYHVVATSTTTLKSAGNSVVKVKKASAVAVGVAVDPAAATVQAGGTLTFSATVTGSTVGKVDWTVQEGAACGAISSSGVYSAPGAAATCHVVATAQSDATRSASATVTVTPPISVAITPASPSVQAGGAVAFSATVSNAVAGQSTAVTWSVSAGGGTINATTGAYVAPATAGTYTVTATSVADASRSASVSVTVTAAPLPVAIAISPTTATLDACKGQVFTATVTNSGNTAVTWKVLEAGGGSVTNGIYTAPQAAGTYHVVATSAADPSKSVQGTVTVGAEKVLSVAVSPGAGTVQANGQMTIAATVTTTCGTFAAQ